MTEDSKYFLSVGEVDKERLRRLNDLYNPASQQFLLSNGLRPGMHVLDVACGTGIMTQWLAKLVGPDGWVHAIDQNEEQLAIAQQNTAKLNNVSFDQRSVYDLDALTEQYDVVYSRFLLVHLDEPYKAMHQMRTCLKPNGLLAIMSAIHSAYYSEPKCNAFDQFFELALKIIGQQERDAHYGKKVIPTMKKLGLTIKDSQYFMPILQTKQQKEFVSITLKTIEQPLLESGTTQMKLDQMQQQLAEFSDDEQAYCSFADAILVAGINNSA